MDSISALMDGELGESEAQRRITHLKSDETSRLCWNEFHLIGDVLRSEPVLSEGFVERFSRRLADEPTVLAPRRSVRKPERVLTYGLSAAASIAAAALVAWVALGPTSTPDGSLLASNQTPTGTTRDVNVESTPQPLSSVPSDGRMNEYLLAHEGFSPSTRLQGLAPYIRTVSATRLGDGR